MKRISELSQLEKRSPRHARHVHLVGDECWFCGADVDRSTKLAKTRVWLATLAAVAAGHLDVMHGDYGENVCPACAERLVGPNWPMVALASAGTRAK